MLNLSATASRKGFFFCMNSLTIEKKDRQRTTVKESEEIKIEFSVELSLNRV